MFFYVNPAVTIRLLISCNFSWVTNKTVYMSPGNECQCLLEKRHITQLSSVSVYTNKRKCFVSLDKQACNFPQITELLSAERNWVVLPTDTLAWAYFPTCLSFMPCCDSISAHRLLRGSGTVLKHFETSKLSLLVSSVGQLFQGCPLAVGSLGEKFVAQQSNMVIRCLSTFLTYIKVPF